MRGSLRICLSIVMWIWLVFLICTLVQRYSCQMHIVVINIQHKLNLANSILLWTHIFFVTHQWCCDHKGINSNHVICITYCIDSCCRHATKQHDILMQLKSSTICSWNTNNQDESSSLFVSSSLGMDFCTLFNTNNIIDQKTKLQYLLTRI